jgi:hypothetical protein
MLYAIYPRSSSQRLHHGWPQNCRPNLRRLDPIGGGGHAPPGLAAIDRRLAAVGSVETDVAPACFGRYTVSGVLGEGGYGVVYRGYDGQLRRDVAIKVPRRGRIIRQFGCCELTVVTRSVAACPIQMPSLPSPADWLK